PLFWPIELKEDRILILDETKLPQEVSYVEAKDYLEACSAIKDMKTRAVGQVILVMYTFLLEVRKNKQADLKKVAEAINATRPTLSFKFLTDMMLGWVESGEPLEKYINGFLEGLKYARIRQAEEAARLFNDEDVVLTHCNVSGLLPLIAQICAKENKKISFFVTETRPYLQGSRLTAWELMEAGIDTTIICDDMVAQVMSEGKIKKVIVGADNLAQNGDFANKIGTYQIAILAKHFNIPFFVLCPPVAKAKTGRDINLEIRPDEELLEYHGIRLAPKNAKAYYPAFDITPNELVTKHIFLKIQDMAMKISKPDYGME
ncbi:MAG: S-methyl-5-thioribose-1-phosphate isomerase, partial [Candidatus Omnitrophica bacterium]|nr:S-methyl-5-thioribose-1-phosphate isomerase [Candidatus Omnitrophota bacterium]